MGGGAVQGSLVLVGGAPGIGKSTMMLQICDNLCRFSKVLYVSGEESGTAGSSCGPRVHRASAAEPYPLVETSLRIFWSPSMQINPILIVDSIQIHVR
ncbi:MAG: hypothetical protein ACLSAF_15605 [Intestinimonas sp.]